jgi:hypothetical protein
LLAQKRLKELLHYDPDTGLFTRVKQVGRFNSGEVVGYSNGRGWLRVKIDGKHYKLHRLAFLYMEGEFPPEEVDHKNRIRDDNRWCNLRHATRGKNNVNRLTKGNSDTGYRGVIPSGRGYKAKIQCGGDIRYSITYDNPIDAYRQYCEWAQELFGDFTILREE